MTADTRPAQTHRLIMPLGCDVAPAAALAHACGLDLQQYDLSALTAALGQGQPCIVVWSDPSAAIAAALRDLTLPSQAAALWRQSATDLLALFARHRRRLLLVEAQLIIRAVPADLARLQTRLTLATLPAATAPAADLPAQLARLMAPQLADLRPVWDELLASSLSSLPEPHASADLDPLAHLLAAEAALRTDLHDQLGAAIQRHQTESDQHRATITALSATQDQLHTEADAAAQRISTLQAETGLLRDQLADLISHSAADQAKLSAADTAHATLLQVHSRTQLELNLLRDQLQTLSTAAADQNAAPTEVALLRDQLASVTALLRNTPQDAPTPSQTGLGPAHIQVESAFATLLSALVTETDLRVQAQQQTRSAPIPSMFAGPPA